MAFSDIVDKKQKVRKLLLDRRKSVSSEQIKLSGQTITSRLLSLEEFKRAKIVHIYLSIEKNNEIDTMPIINSLFKMGKRVVVPVTEFDNVALRHVILTDTSKLKKNKWGVPEPIQQDEIEIDQLDLVIIPMVGGDYKCNRIGYGKGYYDSFLQKVKCPKIGLLLDNCLIDELPVEEHDVKLDYIITDKKIIH